MSEHEPLHQHAERHEAESDNNSEVRLQAALEKAERAREDQEKKPNLAELERKAKHEALSSHEEAAKVSERENAPPPQVMTKQLKQRAYKHTLKQAQHRLKPAERTFSKLVHQPAVDKISEVGAKTVARPSGILGGGLVAFLGSSVLLYLARSYGFKYNLFVFIVLFVGGFALGTLLEILIRTLFVRHRHQD